MTNSLTSSISAPDLSLRFGKIDLPDTIELGDEGKVKVILDNIGNGLAAAPVTIKLYISTDNSIDSNDGLLTSQTIDNFNLKPGRSLKLDLNYQNLTSIVAPGAYHLIAKLEAPGIAELQTDNNTVSKLVSGRNTDMVIDWNAIALNAIQAQGKADLANGAIAPGIPPTQGSRLLAIMSIAMYEAVNSFKQHYEPYAIDASAPQGASKEAAVVGAAYQVLMTLLPQQANLFNEGLEQCLEEIKKKPIKEMLGFEFGKSIADQILALRENDGSDDNTPYNPPSGDYVWHSDPPNHIAIGANWGKVKPFAISSVSDFAPNGLDGTVGTDRYIQDIEEVRTLGARNNTNLTTITRNADQTEIAHFWAYDRADTFRPYGQLNQIAQEIALREDNSLMKNARLFAQLNIALADAAIVAWDMKYKMTQPRPDYVIAGGIAANDGIDATVGDPDWQPLLNTPPFPDYISGHSVFGGAFAGVLRNFYGDDYQFTAVSQELPGVTRNLTFSDAAFEDAISRVYGGIHVREATVDDALPTGLAVGNFVATNLFQPLHG